jgi:hypothetical protein
MNPPRPGDPEGPGGGPPGPPASGGEIASPAPRLPAARIAVWVAVSASLVDACGGAYAWLETKDAIGADPQGRAADLQALSIEPDAVDRLNLAGSVAAITALASFVLLLVAGVLVLRWQAVAVRNQRALGVAAPRYGVSAAGWCWFVPIWSLFGPKRTYDDLWTAAEPRPTAPDAWATPADAEASRRPPSVVPEPPTVFRIWWGAWLVAVVTGTVAARVPDGTLGGDATAYAIGIASSLALVVAGGLFVQVLETITARHDERRLRALVDGTR